MSRQRWKIAKCPTIYDSVVVGSGTGLTHAGLLLAFKLIGYPARVYGICVRRNAAAQRARVMRCCEALSRLLSVPISVNADDMHVHDEALGQGYGRMGADTIDALVRTARLEGLVLDPVYTAKMMSGLFVLAKAGALRSGERVLFIHTGGMPALFAYGSRILDTSVGR